MYGDVLYVLGFMTLGFLALAAAGRVADWMYERKRKERYKK